MPLPTKGCLVRADGTIAWAWEHNDPTTEFPATPPLLLDADGTPQDWALPGDVVLDLADIALEPEDIALFYAGLGNARAHADEAGDWHFTKMVGVDEVEHPLETVLRVREKHPRPWE